MLNSEIWFLYLVYAAQVVSAETVKWFYSAAKDEILHVSTACRRLMQ